MDNNPFIVACVIFIVVSAVLSALVIFIRRIGLRLDRWFFRAMPLTKDGFAFITYYSNVAIIWLTGIAVLLSINIIDWRISLISGAVVLLATTLSAIRRKKMLDEKGLALLKKKRGRNPEA